MRSLLLLATWSLVACGSDGGGSGGVPLDNWASELGRATCAKYAECCTPEEFMDKTLGSDDEMQCVQLLSAFGSLLVKAYKDSEAAGRLVYHGDHMQDCIDKLEALSCEQLARDEARDLAALDCENPFEGKVENGAACATDEDCVSEWCVDDSFDTMGNVIMGTCGPAPRAGMPCEGFTCDEGFYCVADVCQEKKADGMTCESETECLSSGCNGGTCGASMVCDGL
jgi:hypothetical protein